jgi:aryl-alcohol dehydrogenase-like predicted oxidoreductase
MKSRIFGRTGRSVSEIGFGAWAIGGAWGNVDDGDAVAALNAALDSGVTFIDTADVYGDGRSERLVAKVLKERPNADVYVATKAGRRLPQQTVAGYTYENLSGWIDRSLKNLGVGTLDLVQLHCPPTELYARPEAFDALDRIKRAGKIRDYGVSVEKIDEAMNAIDYPGVVSVQIIFNIFRQRPADAFFAAARAKNVAIIARVPLASGLLTGKLKADSTFADDDHRKFNRHGEAFDVGETFSGVPYEIGLKAVERVRKFVPGDATMAQLALRWILMFDAVTVAIPGARNAAQAESNARAAGLARLSAGDMAALKAIYDEDIAPHVHRRW